MHWLCKRNSELQTTPSFNIPHPVPWCTCSNTSLLNVQRPCICSQVEHMVGHQLCSPLCIHWLLDQEVSWTSVELNVHKFMQLDKAAPLLRKSIGWALIIVCIKAYDWTSMKCPPSSSERLKDQGSSLQNGEDHGIKSIFKCISEWYLQNIHGEGKLVVWTPTCRHSINSCVLFSAYGL